MLEYNIEVEVDTLTHMLAVRDWPARYDVLVVDVEGAEIDVLNGYDLQRWRPTLAIIETHEKIDSSKLSTRAVPIGEYFAGHDYAKVHSDSINTLYVAQ